MDVSMVYKATLAASGGLKLRAKALLAEGEHDNVFEACVLLHEVARMEARAVDALAVCPPETRLLASIEQCWSLVDGRDPPQAGEVWGRILEERGEVEPPTAEAMLVRLTPKYAEQQRTFARHVGSSSAIIQLRATGSTLSLPATARASARTELTTLLDLYPGVPSFWWMEYRLAEADKDKDAAWLALAKARQLDPENRRFEAMSLLVGAWALPLAQADRHLAGVRGRFQTTGPEICLMYALAEIQLARRADPALQQQRWQRAKEAAQAGLSQSPQEGLHKNLRAADMLAGVLLAGENPTMDILYRAGLAHLAVASNSNADIVELFTKSVHDLAA